jgi:HSP20 family protein
MSITRYNPVWADFTPTSFGHLIDRFFNDPISRSGGTAYAFSPQVDIIEREKDFTLQVAVPGMDKDEFKISVDGDRLTVAGERKQVTESKDFRHRELRYGAFSRSFVLPDEVDKERIEARYDKGILSLVIPKAEKKLQKTTIKVA